MAMLVYLGVESLLSLIFHPGKVGKSSLIYWLGPSESLLSLIFVEKIVDGNQKSGKLTS